MLFGRDRSRTVTAEEALPGRPTQLTVPEVHHVTGHRIRPPFPDGLRTAVFGMGCFWGAERLFWQIRGVYSTAVGYAGGFTENPTRDLLRPHRARRGRPRRVRSSGGGLRTAPEVVLGRP